MAQSEAISASRSVLKCAVSGWEAERHVFFGDAPKILSKVSAASLGRGRRLFYAVTQAEGSSQVAEYEHKHDNTYTVRIAAVDPQVADQFNSEVEQVMWTNQGRSCVGEAVKSSAAYQGLQFQQGSEQTLHPATEFAALLGFEESAQAHTLHDGGRFHKLTVHVLC